jgi:hypothetical protein
MITMSDYDERWYVSGGTQGRPLPLPSRPPSCILALAASQMHIIASSSKGSCVSEVLYAPPKCMYFHSFAPKLASVFNGFIVC